MGGLLIENMLASDFLCPFYTEEQQQRENKLMQEFREIITEKFKSWTRHSVHDGVQHCVLCSCIYYSNLESFAWIVQYFMYLFSQYINHNWSDVSFDVSLCKKVMIFTGLSDVVLNQHTAPFIPHSPGHHQQYPQHHLSAPSVSFVSTQYPQRHLHNLRS